LIGIGFIKMPANIEQDTPAKENIDGNHPLKKYDKLRSSYVSIRESALRISFSKRYIKLKF